MQPFIIVDLRCGNIRRKSQCERIMSISAEKSAISMPSKPPERVKNKIDESCGIKKGSRKDTDRAEEP